MTELKIDNRESNYAAIYREMKIGDSYLCEGDNNVMTCKFYNNATTYGYREGKKFAGRKVKGGVKVWRVK